MNYAKDRGFSSQSTGKWLLDAPYSLQSLRNQPALPETWPAPKRKDLHFLEALFGSRARARALVVLIEKEGELVRLTELGRLTGTTPSTLRKALAPLLEVGILRFRVVGQRKFFLAADPDHPAYEGLKQLLISARGEAKRVRHEAKPSVPDAEGFGHFGKPRVESRRHSQSVDDE